MKKVDFPPAVLHLIQELRRLPSIGPRSAERMAIWLLQDQKAQPESLSQALSEAAIAIAACPVCGFFTSQDQCELCANESLDNSQICVVEQATDVIKIERSGAFRGLFHCLGGKLSPLDDVGPEDLRISQLIQRIREQKIEEVILAMGSDVEGEATANYLIEELADLNCSVSRIAQGLPAGGGLDHADDLTLLRAISDRKRL